MKLVRAIFCEGELFSSYQNGTGRCFSYQFGYLLSVKCLLRIPRSPVMSPRDPRTSSSQAKVMVNQHLKTPFLPLVKQFFGFFIEIKQ